MTMDDDLPAPRPAEKTGGLSWVWLMPVLAALIALAMVWQNWAGRGPVITVTFPSAGGIEAGRTPLRFRDLDVGLVEAVSFSDGLAAIEVHIRLNQDIAPYVDDEAEFWLVEPQVTARGVTGLSTVLSGVFIQGSWDGTPTGSADRFAALSEQPLSSADEAGTRIVLRSRSGGQLAAGAPVLFNGIEVGWIGKPVLSESGLLVTRDAFIEAPYDGRLSTASRFWDSSGLSLDIGASGVVFNVDSLAALVQGGVSFGTLVSGGQAIEPGHVFDVFDSLKSARADALAGSGSRLSVSALMDPAAAGITPGTVVRYGRASVGEVVAVTGYRARPSDAVQLLVDLEIIPERLGLDAGLTSAAQVAELAARVAGGLRLRLAAEGLLGQATILEFVQLAEAGPAVLDRARTPHPLVPTAPARVGDATEGIDGLVGRLSDLPIEDLMTSAIAALDSLQELASSPEARELPANANGLIADARDLVGAEEIRAALADFHASARDLRSLTDEIRTSPGLAALLTSLESSGEITANLALFSDRLPALADDVEAVTGQIREMPLAEVATSLDRLAGTLDEVLRADGIDALPASIVATLDELKTVLAEIRAGGAVDNLNRTLAAAESSLAAVETATEQVPEVVARLDAAVATLQGAVASYAPGSRFEVELATTLRDIAEAADAFRSLSQSLERNPNALITGR